MGMCEHCRKAQATFHMTSIDSDSEKSERHLCEKCAVEEGHIQIQKHAITNEILEQFVQGAKASAQNVAGLVCEECGITYVEFRNQGPLGCPNDYDAFKQALGPLIERAHDGATHHVGKTPRSLGKARPPEQDLARLRRQLQESVDAEDYKRAAAIRDRIRELESP